MKAISQVLLPSVCVWACDLLYLSYWNYNFN